MSINIDSSDIVSVIVPVYKAEKYLERCINSLLEQTYKNIQIILVDDGSPDRCGEICDSYVSYANVKVIHQENQGVSAARNAGLDGADGEWIAFVDSDDYVQENYVEYLLGLCIQYKVKIAQCAARIKSDNAIDPLESYVCERVWEFRDLYMSKKRDFRGLVWGKLYHKSVFKNIRFPVNIGVAEDEDVAFRAMYVADRCVISNRRLYYYYLSPSSILRMRRSRICLDVIEVYETRLQFLKDHGENELIDITRKELCIRLCMNYCRSKYEVDDKEGIAQIRGIFLDQYVKIKRWDMVSLAERSALLLFRYMPNIFAFAERNMSIIKRANRRRELRQ